jgi:PEP-CTERM motif
VDSSNNVKDYPTIGFTNANDGSGQFRIWNDVTGVYTYLTTPVNYDAFNTLSIDFTGTSFIYSINGTQVGTLASDPTATQFKSAILNTSNLYAPGSSGTQSYDTYYDNFKFDSPSIAAVPEPSTLTLSGIGVITALGGLWRSRNRTKNEVGPRNS